MRDGPDIMVVTAGMVEAGVAAYESWISASGSAQRDRLANPAANLVDRVYRKMDEIRRGQTDFAATHAPDLAIAQVRR